MDRYRINNHGPSKKIQVIDNETGKVLRSWSYKRFEGEGVTQKRRIKNANSNANNYIQSLQNKISLAGDDAT